MGKYCDHTYVDIGVVGNPSYECSKCGEDPLYVSESDAWASGESDEAPIFRPYTPEQVEHCAEQTPTLLLCKLVDRAEKAEQEVVDLHREIWELEARTKLLEETLEWYGENARLCRLIHSGGDVGRYALAGDGGKRAFIVLGKVS